MTTPRPDCDYFEARRRLSVPDRGGITRRRFLQAAVAGTAGMMLIDTPFGRSFTALADAATPLSADQGILVVLLLGDW
jgi:hypothetical protein